jgi:hypothetical protein
MTTPHCNPLHAAVLCVACQCEREASVYVYGCTACGSPIYCMPGARQSSEGDQCVTRAWLSRAASCFASRRSAVERCIHCG